ncbi:hypothetical protein ACLUWS_03295 [Bifidobacterium boum]|uniref:hypothetical protein n=1 Tax=Bifidobacterium boum TaxID=78343 RepID=UPI003992623A
MAVDGGAITTTFGAQWCGAGNPDCLPVLRWASDAGTLNNRTDGFIQQVTSIFSSIPLNVEGVFLSMGNGMWSAAAWLARQAGGVDVASTVGPKANEIAHNLYAALTGDWMLLGLALFAAMAFGLWQAWRHSNPKEMTRRIGCAVLGVALFVSMGAASTSGGAVNTSASPMTPYWTTNLAIRTISQVGAGAMNSFDKGFDGSGGMLAGQPNGRWMLTSCRRYTANLRNAYLQQHGNDTVLNNLDRMWEETGLRLWIRAQYGPGDTGMTTFCRVLEDRAAVPADAQAAFTKGDATLVGGRGETADYSRKGKMANINPDGIIFWPATLVTKSDSQGKSLETAGAANERRLDRMQVMWDTCAINPDGNITIRAGWGFVGDIQGSERGEEGTRATGSGHSALQGLKENCSIALTGTYSGMKDGPLLTHDGDGIMNIVSAKDSKDQKIKNVAEKFDLDESIAAHKDKDNDWKALILGKNHGASDRNKREASNTITHQHGAAAISDLGGAFIFAIAGIVNLVIFGLILGFMRLVATTCAFLVAGLGLPVAFLILAFAPDKGKKAIQGALGQVIGMSAGVTVIGLVAGLDCLVTTTFMDLLGVFNDNVGVAPLAIASLIIPPLGLKILQWFCINVWKIGDPMSWGAFGALMAGKKVMKGIGKVAAGAVAGAAALAAGGGMASAIGAAEHGYASGGSPLGLIRAGAAGSRAGEQDAYFRERAAERKAQGKYGPVPSDKDDAEHAAGASGGEGETPEVESGKSGDEATPESANSAPDGEPDADDAAGAEGETPESANGAPDGEPDADDAAGAESEAESASGTPEATDGEDADHAAGNESTSDDEAMPESANSIPERVNGTPDGKLDAKGEADGEATPESANGTSGTAKSGDADHAADTTPADDERAHRTKPDKQDWAEAYSAAHQSAHDQAEQAAKAGQLHDGETVKDRENAIYQQMEQNGEIEKAAWATVPKQQYGRTEPNDEDWGKARVAAWSEATRQADWAEQHHKLPQGMDAKEYAQSVYDDMKRDGDITRRAWANMDAAHATPNPVVRAAQRVSDFATAHPVVARAAAMTAASTATVLTGGAAAPVAFGMAAAVNSAATRRGILHKAGLGLGHGAQAVGGAVKTKATAVATRVGQLSHLADDHPVAGTAAGVAAGAGVGGAMVAAGAALTGATAGMAAPVTVPLMAAGLAVGGLGANAQRIRGAVNAAGGVKGVAHAADRALGGFETHVSNAWGRVFDTVADPKGAAATSTVLHTPAEANRAARAQAQAALDAEATVQTPPEPSPVTERVRTAAARAAATSPLNITQRLADAQQTMDATGYTPEPSPVVERVRTTAARAAARVADSPLNVTGRLADAQQAMDATGYTPEPSPVTERIHTAAARAAATSPLNVTRRLADLQDIPERTAETNAAVEQSSRRIRTAQHAVRAEVARELDRAETDYAQEQAPDSWSAAPTDQDMADMERQAAEEAKRPHTPSDRPDPF